MSTTLPCPAVGDHGTECICNGARELIVRPKTALCETCGDPAAQRNLGFVANVEGRIVGTPCTDCGTVGDVAEFARRKAAADAAAGPDVVPDRSEFARAVGSGKPRLAVAPKPVDQPKFTRRTDDSLLADLRGTSLFTQASAQSGLDNGEQRAALMQNFMSADDAERPRIASEIEDLDQLERICRRILAELSA